MFAFWHQTPTQTWLWFIPQPYFQLCCLLFGSKFLDKLYSTTTIFSSTTYCLLTQPNVLLSCLKIALCAADRLSLLLNRSPQFKLWYTRMNSFNQHGRSFPNSWQGVITIELDYTFATIFHFPVFTFLHLLPFSILQFLLCCIFWEKTADRVSLQLNWTSQPVLSHE